MDNYLKYTLLILVLTALSCGPDDDDITMMEGPSPFAFQLNPDCQEYENYVINSSAGAGTPTRFLKFNELIVFGGTNAILVQRGFGGGEVDTHHETQLQVNDLLEINNKVLVCTYRGLFEVSSSGAITRINEKSCFDLEFDGERLYTTTFDDSIDGNNPSKSNLFAVDTETYEYEVYNDPGYTDTYLFLYDLEKLQDKIYVMGTIDNEVAIVEFQDGVFNSIYNKDSDSAFQGISTQIFVGNSKLFTVAGNLMFFTDNGPYKQLLVKKPDEGEFQQIGHWHIEGEITDELYHKFMWAHDNVFRVVEHVLYVSSSEGLFKFTFNDDLSYTYKLMVDEGFPNNNWIDFSIHDGDIDLVLLNHQDLLRNTCRN